MRNEQGQVITFAVVTTQQPNEESPGTQKLTPLEKVQCG